MRTTRSGLLFVFCAALLAASSYIRAEDVPGNLNLASPISCQVFQRDKADQAEILVEGSIGDQADAIEAKADLVPGAKRGTPAKWVVIASQEQIVQG